MERKGQAVKLRSKRQLVERVCKGSRHGVQHDVCDAGRPKLWVVLAPWGVTCEECCGRAASLRKRGPAGLRHEKIEVAAALFRLPAGGRHRDRLYVAPSSYYSTVGISGGRLQVTP